MIDLNLQMFGGGGSKSGGGGGGGHGSGHSEKKKTIKLGQEVTSSRGIKKDEEYIVITGKGEKTVRTGERLLSQIKSDTLKYDKELYHWVGSKGSYIIRKIRK